MVPQPDRLRHYKSTPLFVTGGLPVAWTMAANPDLRIGVSMARAAAHAAATGRVSLSWRRTGKAVTSHRTPNQVAAGYLFELGGTGRVDLALDWRTIST
jgi:hypothetical protein